MVFSDFSSPNTLRSPKRGCPLNRLFCQLAAGVFLFVATIFLGGCEKPKVATQQPLPSDEQLKAMLDEELNYTYTKR